MQGDGLFQVRIDGASPTLFRQQPSGSALQSPFRQGIVVLATSRTGHSSLPRKHHRVQLHHRSRSEEHTSELQSLMRISYAVFCLKKKKYKQQYITTYSTT